MTASDSGASVIRTFRAATGDLPDIDTWSASVAVRWAPAERARLRARVCIAELVANAIEHGGANSERDTVTITLHRQGPDLGIEYADTAAPFDPTVARVPASALDEEASLGGRGLRLLQAYALQLSYRHDGKRNVINFGVTAKDHFLNTSQIGSRSENPMDIREEKHGNVCVVTVRGRLDGASSSVFAERMEKLISGTQPRLLLDFSGVDFVSSAGLRVVLGTLKKVKAAKGVFALCAVQA